MIKVKVPATTANLGPGFDTLGMALNLYNYISMEETRGGLVIKAIGSNAHRVPKTNRNLAYRAAMLVFDKVAYKPKGLRILIENNIPMVRGLGSSASVIIGGMVAANELSGRRLSTEQILYMATRLEGHPDNVAPALLGGIIISAEFEDEVVYRKIMPPKELSIVVAIPTYELSTREARNALPKDIPMQDAVFNMSRTGLLLWAFMESDLDLMGKVMEDKLHQPYRMSMIPGMQDVVQRAKAQGALAVALSGAGPTLIAFCRKDKVQVVGETMKETFKQFEVDCFIDTVKPDIIGAEIQSRKGE